MSTFPITGAGQERHAHFDENLRHAGAPAFDATARRQSQAGRRHPQAR
ncbi:hypothetical protein [Nonomuraea typhae]|uniref:Uncharacterized protein n=1 Tax=Nonomuraea typhae TaxID=2603600 RepID=A0ABW7YXS3_9ACTN